jgi:gamma-glutamyltranspeptidase/glutathione hydrolase
MTATLTAPFDWNHNYPTHRTPLFARNVVATSQPLAAQAGVRMLLKGGNAVDAAIAAAAAIMIVEPVSNGLGSDCFAIVWNGAGFLGSCLVRPAPRRQDPDAGLGLGHRAGGGGRVDGAAPEIRDAALR